MLERARTGVFRCYKRVLGVPINIVSAIAEVLDNTKGIFYKVFIGCVTANILLFTAVFMYGSFYFAFVPQAAHESQLYLSFDPCFDTPEKCDYLNASISLGTLSSATGSQRQQRNGPVLMAGQPYTVTVALDMPESPKNIDHGMFMACLQMKPVTVESQSTTSTNKPTSNIKSMCRSAMLQYRSPLLRILETFVFAPFLMSGHILEKQRLYIQFFEDFVDDPLNPALRADFVIKSRFVEIYDANLMIHAKFGGLRYFMFYYPVTSAIFGSILNLSILSLTVFLSWIRFFSTKLDELECITNDEVQQKTQEGSINNESLECKQDKTEQGEDDKSRANTDIVVLDQNCEDDSNERKTEE